jgi:hypothetical protein
MFLVWYLQNADRVSFPALKININTKAYEELHHLSRLQQAIDTWFCFSGICRIYGLFSIKEHIPQQAG